MRLSICFIVLTTIVTACGGPGEFDDSSRQGETGPAGSSCSVTPGGAIQCTDGTGYTLPGDSEQVPTQCAVTETETGASIDCPGSTPVNILNGRDGESVIGPVGNTGESIPGPTGEAGSSCTVTQIQPTEEAPQGGAEISCEDGTQAQVLNGSSGQQGEMGPPGSDGVDSPPTDYTVVELIDPCGNSSGFDEVLLRLANGMLMAHYSSGNLQFLTVVGPGSYRTTDASACNFTVNTQLEVSW